MVNMLGNILFTAITSLMVASYYNSIRLGVAVYFGMSAILIGIHDIERKLDKGNPDGLPK